MKLTIHSDVSKDEAEAIALALAEYSQQDVELTIGDDRVITADGPTAANGGNAESASETPLDDLSPTDRERKLVEEIEDIKKGGPEKYKQRQVESGKLFVRDRLELWFDELLFEDGKFANFDAEDRLPADGLLSGGAEFDGRDVHVLANDYTVKAGSRGKRGVEKFIKTQERALRAGKPVLYLLDTSGGRIDQQAGMFANRTGGGKTFYNQSMLSGFVPQISVVYGPSAGGAAYIPVFSDFVVMMEETSAMAIASPRMVEMVTHEEVDFEDLGGPTVHAQHSGSVDLIATDEEDAHSLVSQLFGYLPSNANETPPQKDPRPPVASPEGIDAVIPEKPNVPYSMHDLIERIVDASSFIELQAEYGKEIVTGFGRIEGQPVGIVANQPSVRAGAIYPDSAEKAAEFIWKCDSFSVPLLYLCDTPGFMAGSNVERDGILDKGKKLIYATANATVPQYCTVVRKAYGAGIYAMCGPPYEPESVIALPSAEIAVMGPEAAINALYQKQLNDITDPEERQRREDELREEYRKDIDIHRMASEVVIDEIIPPSSLRDELANRRRFYDAVESVHRPDKKHGSIF